MLEAREVASDLGEHGEVVDPDEGVDHEQGGRLGVIQDIADLVALVAGVHRDDDRADPGDGEVDDDPLRDVRHPQADLVPLLHAELDQPARKPVDLGGELAVRAATVPEDDRRAVGERRRRVRKDSGKRSHGLTSNGFD